MTRRRLLMATTAIVGALGSGVYKILDQKKERPITGIKERPTTGIKEGPTTGIEEGPAQAMQDGPIAAIARIAAQSAIIRYSWQDRGVAPGGYIKGMALVYARVYLKLKAGDAAALDMAKANTGDANHDALAYYADIFDGAGMSNSVSGAVTLRHLFVLLIGLGMRESGGRYCTGADISTVGVGAEQADAGLFGTAYSSTNASPLMTGVFKYYSANPPPKGFADVFGEGLICRAEDFQAIGTGVGEQYQWLSKESPAFAAEFAAVGLRHGRTHWGPISTRAAQVVPECDAMLSQVQAFVAASPNIHAPLL
jgi:hypothetical protein